jgi:hypothetical protein
MSPNEKCSASQMTNALRLITEESVCMFQCACMCVCVCVYVCVCVRERERVRVSEWTSLILYPWEETALPFNLSH